MAANQVTIRSEVELDVKLHQSGSGSRPAVGTPGSVQQNASPSLLAGGSFKEILQKYVVRFSR